MDFDNFKEDCSEIYAYLSKQYRDNDIKTGVL